jgi:hypothetical protein
MIGIVFLIILGLWLFIAWKLAKRPARHIESTWKRSLVRVLAFTVIAPVPVADELWARHQVERLCRTNAVLVVNEEAIRNTRVRYLAKPSNERVAGVAVPVLYTRSVLVDELSGRQLASRGEYTVSGGLLIRALGSSQFSPLVVRSSCAPEQGLHEISKILNFEILN